MFKYTDTVWPSMDIDTRKMGRGEFRDSVTVFQYESPGHYRVSICESADGWTVTLKREDFRETFRKRANDKVITPYKGNSEIYGAFVDGAYAGFIQIEFQEHNRSVRVWDIDILREFRGKGAGRALMDLCKSRSRELGARRIILETQTCNLKAIAFYRAMGFGLAGLDATNYQNDDIERGEVRLEMAYYL
jgi:ribosomal protein S18 acetylase RimI-like enzyme